MFFLIKYDFLIKSQRMRAFFQEADILISVIWIRLKKTVRISMVQEVDKPTTVNCLTNLCIQYNNMYSTIICTVQ